MGCTVTNPLHTYVKQPSFPTDYTLTRKHTHLAKVHSTQKCVPQITQEVPLVDFPG